MARFDVAAHGPTMNSYDDTRREVEITELLARLSLNSDLLAAADTDNTSAAAGYHGYQHLLTVAINSAAGARAQNIGGRSLARLVIAALFHDVDHSQDAHQPDSHNIERAVSAFLRYASKPTSGLCSEDRAVIERVIRATEFPHSSADGPLEQLIQDADVLQTLEPDAGSFIRGLRTETGHDITRETSDIFLRSHHLNTAWAEARLAAHFFEDSR